MTNRAWTPIKASFITHRQREATPGQRGAGMTLGLISSCPLERKAFGALLATSRDLRIGLELESPLEGLQAVRAARPEVLIVDTLDPLFSLEKVRQLLKAIPEIKVILLARNIDEEFEFQAIRSGVRGYVPRTSQPEILEKAVRAVARGEVWISHRVASRLIGVLIHQGDREESSKELTCREWEVLALVASGSTNKEIADRLCVAESTIKSHLWAIFKKIKVRNRLAAALYYFQSSREHYSEDAMPEARSKAKPALHRGKRRGSTLAA